LNDKDVHLNYLPLAHVYEKVIYNCVAIAGAKLGVFNGDITKLKDDMAAL